MLLQIFLFAVSLNDGLPRDGFLQNQWMDSLNNQNLYTHIQVVSADQHNEGHFESVENGRNVHYCHLKNNRKTLVLRTIKGVCLIFEVSLQKKKLQKCHHLYNSSHRCRRGKFNESSEWNRFLLAKIQNVFQNPISDDDFRLLSISFFILVWELHKLNTARFFFVRKQNYFPLVLHWVRWEI